MASVLSTFAVRSSAGISVNSGSSSNYGADEAFTPDTSKACKTMTFSRDGKLFAWVNGQTIKVVSTKDWRSVAELQHPKTSNMAFSPQGTYFMCWEPFAITKAQPTGSPNLQVYSTADWKLVKGIVHKRQADWEPQWSLDESMCARLVNGEVHFFEGGNFESFVQKTKNVGKVAAFGLAPGAGSDGSYHVLCHTPGNNNQPALARLLKYPRLDGQNSIANKSFMQADHVDFQWNCRGTSALIITSTEVDRTGASYYGRQALHYVSTRGDTSMVTFSKDGPLQCVQWSPSGTEFCAVYGFMPASATIFNLKCEPIVELGEGSRNQVHYNPHGTLVLLAGFGNLRGHVEMWDVAAKKKVGECDAPDSTQLNWSPDGEHFLTATTSPRLRTGNGWKLWHCSGDLLQEHPWQEGQELYEVRWMPQPDLPAPTVDFSSRGARGIRSSQPQPSKQVYRPPNQRNVSFTPAPVTPMPPSKNALKQKKKREAKKAANAAAAAASATENGPAAVAHKTPGTGIAVTLTGDADKDKKIKNLKKKLDAIEKLKEQRDAGDKPLEVNQLAKIDAEADLLRQLTELQAA